MLLIYSVLNNIPFSADLSLVFIFTLISFPEALKSELELLSYFVPSLYSVSDEITLSILTFLLPSLFISYLVSKRLAKLTLLSSLDASEASIFFRIFKS